MDLLGHLAQTGRDPRQAHRLGLRQPGGGQAPPLLLAGLYATGETEIIEPHPTRDYTERMLAAFGWPIVFAPGHAKLEGGHLLRARDVDVPADFSSAAFFLVAASIVPGSALRLLMRSKASTAALLASSCATA